MNEECILAKVFVIIRPMDENNQEPPEPKRVVRLNETSVQIFYSNKLDKVYDFDHVFPLDVPRETIFNSCLSEIIKDVITNNKNN